MIRKDLLQEVAFAPSLNKGVTGQGVEAVVGGEHANQRETAQAEVQGVFLGGRVAVT